MSSTVKSSAYVHTADIDPTVVKSGATLEGLANICVTAAEKALETPPKGYTPTQRRFAQRIQRSRPSFPCRLRSPLTIGRSPFFRERTRLTRHSRPTTFTMGDMASVVTSCAPGRLAWNSRRDAGGRTNVTMA